MNINIRENLGRVLLNEEISQQGLSFFHVSYEDKNIGDSWNSKNYLNSRHYRSFFLNPPDSRYFSDVDFINDRRAVEKIFEEVRNANYPDRTSRQKAIFSSLSLFDAVVWANKGPRRGNFIYEIKVVGTLSIHGLFWFNWAIRKYKKVLCDDPFPDDLFPNASDQEKLILSAKNYWSGEMNYPKAIAQYETLTEGEVVVIAKYDKSGQKI